MDTSRIHYVRVPENHIVIDFDILDKDGNKSFEENFKEASNWGVYGKAKDTGRWRALTACEPDQEGAEHLASVLNNSFTGPLWMPQ